MKSKRSLVDAAIELANNQVEHTPEVCSHCSGKGETKGLFSAKWECLHCDGLGYTGDPIAIAKWFKSALIQRTEKLQQLGSHCGRLNDENDVLKVIYPDWEQKLKEHYEQETHDKCRSRFD
ncbi:hypothetical protein R8O05_21330 [Vibrio sp. 1865]|uniref:hypothetical protein n=1 Tax=Vibrio TaxID=662 RepID=UPI001C9BC274|nr:MULTISPECIES: hypothetical protein [Vibrio]MBY7719691.1 hypothetical protein [Vibrio parahaemolyticus]MDF5600761.1 hypothetical protein [Vibrio parahaemolyticus]MDW2094078.1 hypothetical protein [Vibrio sp. 1866]MDW3103755.1 hypothetical protein [Vibrio sp. 1874]MDW3201857.1 hypothetical protein [Vibrio sp. 1865]